MDISPRLRRLAATNSPRSLAARIFAEADHLRSVPTPTAAEAATLRRADRDPRCEAAADRILKKYTRLIQAARAAKHQRENN